MSELELGTKLSVKVQSANICGMSCFGTANAHPYIVDRALFFSVLIALSALGACVFVSHLPNVFMLATVSLPRRHLKSSPSTRSERMVCPLLL